MDWLAKSFSERDASPAADSEGFCRGPLRLWVPALGAESPLHEGSCCSPGDLGSSLMRTTDTEGDEVRADALDCGTTGVMVMEVFLSSTLASGNRGAPDDTP